MKKNDLHDALSGINKDFIAESDDFKAVSADFRKVKSRKNRIIISTLCLVFVGIGVIGTAKSGLLKKDLQTTEKDIGIISSDESNISVPVSSTVAAVIDTEQPSVNENPIINEPLYYSKLVKNTDIPELNGYDISVSLDIAAFDESMLNDSAGVIEGEIIDLWVNQYEYATASDKFEPDGQIYHKPSTVAYKIKIDRVLSGDFSVGDIITIEDYHFILDSIVSIKKGGKYVIPLGKGDGKFFDHDKIISGDTNLESCYYTLYQFHPQIEKVSGGYIVPGDWKTLITDDCTEIIMDIVDIDNVVFSFPGPLYYVPDSIFNDRITHIIQS